MLTANLAISLIGLALCTASGNSGRPRAVVYHHGGTSMSWENAASYCAHRGWRLAQFNSDYDLSALKHEFQSSGIVWIGLASTEVGSTTYQWTDCTPYGDYKRAPWDSEEPNFLDSQLCVMMKAFKFKTNVCSKKFNILCEEIQDPLMCIFQPASRTAIPSQTEQTTGATMSAESDCQDACLGYQEVKQCIGYHYHNEMCRLYLGQSLLFPNSTSSGKDVSIKVCHFYQTIGDTAMESWDESFSLTCDESLTKESTSNKLTDGVTKTAYSATTDGLTYSHLLSSSVTMVTTTGIHPTSYHLQSSNMMDTSVESTMTQTAVLPSSTIHEDANEPSRVLTSTAIIMDTVSLSEHMQTSAVETGPTKGSLSAESYSSDALLMSSATMTGSMYAATTGSAEVPQSPASDSADMLHVSSATLTGTVYGTTTGTTEVPQSLASDSTDMLQKSSTTLTHPEHATTSRVVSTACVCPCGSLESRIASHSSLIKELIVKKTTLSSFKRKKTSARDERPSAQAIGNIGIVLLAVAGVFILILDADVLARLIGGLFKPR